MNILYDLRNITKRLEGKTVLKNVSLVIEEGECLALIGSNGSGKTMLIRVLAGILRPDEGTVLYRGKRLGQEMEFPPNQGVIIETPTFWPDMSGRDNLRYLAGIRRRIGDEDIDQWVRFYELEESIDSEVRKYSLGMRQKLGLIQAFMEQPDLLLLDEPFNSLDPMSVKKTQAYLQTFLDQGGTLIMCSHHAGDFADLPNRTLRMIDGEIYEA